MYDYIVIPGRHHAVTDYQVNYFTSALKNGTLDLDGNLIEFSNKTVLVFVVTSANHAYTRRNPLPGHRRESMLEVVASQTGLPILVVQIPDVLHHPRFSSLVIETINNSLPGYDKLNPTNTVVACSTDIVILDYLQLGYKVIGVEKAVTPTAQGPWQVIEQLSVADENWRNLAHTSVTQFYDRYKFPDQVIELYRDPTVSAEGDLTATRDYRTYKAAFENASERKWDIVKNHLKPGRILDVGCASGGLLEFVAAQPELAECDLYGVDIARPLLEEAEHKKAMGAFVNPNIWFIRANLLSTQVMEPNTVDTTCSIALTHEIYSYGDKQTDIGKFIDRIYAHTRPGGVWINSDVAAPENKDQLIHLTLDTTDGVNPDSIHTGLDDLKSKQVSKYVKSLSTNARMRQFVYDFTRLADPTYHVIEIREGVWETTMGDAYEFLTTKDYFDNWLSECHEMFCAFGYTDWENMLTAAGFKLLPASEPVINQWLIDNRFNPVASLTDAVTGEHVDWRATHVLTVAQKN